MQLFTLHKFRLCKMEQAQPENSIFVFRCQEACVYLLNNFDWCLDPPVQNLEYKWLPVSRPANPPTVTFTQQDHTLSGRSDTS